MKHFFAAAGALALVTGAADAAGVERTTQSIGILFEGGNYAELTFGSIRPSISGVDQTGRPSGDMAGDFHPMAMGVKTVVSPVMDFALILDSPYGAYVDYPLTGYYAEGSQAELDSMALTAVARYRFPSDISLIGGVRYQTLSASASVPFIFNYSVTGKKDAGLGYLLGIAYEKPEIALRVSLVYNSSITHRLATVEGGAVSRPTEIDTPQSVNLEFQSGVAEDTLLFGSVRWVDWSDFTIDPERYVPPEPLVSYTGDTTTYTLGVGRRFTENWSGSISVAYEGRLDGNSSNLGPNNGRRSVTVGASYTHENFKISGGATYIDLGDARTEGLPGVAGTFTGNHAVGVGMRIGYSF